MKKIVLFVMAICINMYAVVAQEAHLPAEAKAVFDKKAEIYFKTPVENPADIRLLVNKMSIDTYTPEPGAYAYVYANKKEFAYFLSLNMPYEILVSPGDAMKDPKMYAGGKGDFPWNAYPTYEAYVAKMNQFAIDHPDICQVFSIGKSVQGRDILMAKISDNVGTEEAEPKFLYTGQIHGDEIVTYIMFLHLIDEIVEKYGTDTQITNLVNNMEIWINPLANPDGTYITGNNTVSGATRANANGVDMNRNYPDPIGGAHTDGHEYQPETILFMNLGKTHNFVMSSNAHSGTEVVNYPWDTWHSSNRHADNDWWELVSHEYADTARFYSGSYPYFDGFDNGVTHGSSWYQVQGGRQDYMNYFNSCRELTLELSDVKMLPASQLIDHWNYNRNAMLNYIQEATYGFQGKVTDKITGAPIRAKIELVNHDKDHSYVYSDATFGMYYRPALAGTYTIKVSAECYESVVLENIAITNFQVVENNVQLVPKSLSADFVANDTVVSVGTKLQYTNISCGNPDSYQWTFEGGSPATSTEANPEVTYAEEGVYNTTLVITKDGESLTLQRKNYIQVAAPLLMTNGEQVSCNAIFMDSGGDNGNYADNEDMVMTIKADNDANVSSLNVKFIAFDVEDHSSCNYDYLAVYDGASTSAALLGTYCGTTVPGPFKSNNADKALTFKFHADNSTNRAGWKAVVRCHYLDNVEEMESAAKVVVYPNPVQDIIHIDADDAILQLQIIAINGNVLRSLAPKTSKAVLDVADLAAGMYFVSVETSRGVAYKKVQVR